VTEAVKFDRWSGQSRCGIDEIMRVRKGGCFGAKATLMAA